MLFTVIEPTFVSTIVKFFENEFSKKDELTLVELMFYFDGRMKTLPSADEVNKAIETYKKVSLRRDGKEVYFVKIDAETETVNQVTQDEMKRANKRYRKEFWKKYKNLLAGNT